MNDFSGELAYVIEIANRSPTLAREHELELTRRFRDSGDRGAADTLARAYLRLVISIALTYRHSGVSLSELVAEGNCGLVAALGKFDPERGVRFGTYAKHWVHAHVVACVIRSSNALGGTKLVNARLFFKLRRERARVRAVFGEGATADEALAQRLELDPERLRELLGRLDCRSVSLDSAAGPETGGNMLDTLASGDNPEERYFEGYQSDAATSAVKLALAALNTRERFIAEHRLMANSDDELSLAEIAREWGLSRERVRQLEERTKHKLQKSAALKRNCSVSEWITDH